MTVYIETIKPGDGKTYPKKGDTVKINYVGKFQDGRIFASTQAGYAFECKIGVGQVIKGWDEGVMKLSLGEQARLTIPPEDAYGSHGFGSVIGPDSTLIFDIELLGIS
ncbi:18436_t:CDS:2 [Acaulospora morrowiae]|uniref:peptidylprolyl isomerase n=1 Tax=Acaulospora morrowiae TaxID=94023 RepID=A0A9N9DFU8_9GLOM|nr:18436_t:CDS:2 [Acaulospora morrowiae]